MSESEPESDSISMYCFALPLAARVGAAGRVSATSLSAAMSSSTSLSTFFFDAGFFAAAGLLPEGFRAVAFFVASEGPALPKKSVTAACAVFVFFAAGRTYASSSLSSSFRGLAILD